MKKIFLSFIMFLTCALNAQVITLIDSNTKESVNFERIASLPEGAVLDGVLYAKKDGYIYARRYEGGINPKWYGAKGDGRTNDTSAFQKMVNTLSDGSYVFIPKGNFVIDGVTVDHRNNIIFDGVGSVVRSSSGTANTFVVQYCKNVEFRNFSIDGVNTNDTTNGYQLNGFLTVKCSNIKFTGMSVNNQGYGGILATDTSDLTVSGCRFSGNRKMADIAFGYATPDSPLNNAIIINNTSTSANYFGILVQGYGENVLISGNKISNKTVYGINVYRRDFDQSKKWHNVQITDNTVSNISDVSDIRNSATQTYYGMGIFLQTVDKVIVRGNIVKNVLQSRTETPFSRTLTPAAISLGDCTNFIVEGNIVKDSGVDGITITTVYNYDNNLNIVSNNTVENTGYYGISLVNISNAQIIGNSVVNSRNIGFHLNNNGQGNNLVSNVYFSDNIVNNDMGFEITGYQVSGASQNITFHSNTAINTKLYAYNVTDVDGLNFIANSIISDKYKAATPYHAIQVANVSHLIFTGNQYLGKSDFFYSKTGYFNNVSAGIIKNNIVSGGANFEIYNPRDLVNTDNLYNK